MLGENLATLLHAPCRCIGCDPISASAAVLPLCGNGRSGHFRCMQVWHVGVFHPAPAPATKHPTHGAATCPGVYRSQWFRHEIDVSVKELCQLPIVSNDAGCHPFQSERKFIKNTAQSRCTATCCGEVPLTQTSLPLVLCRELETPC